uniref:Uncharacterized protein n=1 Tax=Neogobius melanostomus TaxID=47308 RepID=A0A8C6UC40_9GOBI
MAVTPATGVRIPATKRAKLESDRRRQKTRVNIGEAFEKWKILREYLEIITKYVWKKVGLLMLSKQRCPCVSPVVGRFLG